jgi:hypothetical protein
VGLRCLIFPAAWTVSKAAHFSVGVARDAEQKYGSKQYHHPTKKKNDPKQHGAYIDSIARRRVGTFNFVSPG